MGKRLLIYDDTCRGERATLGLTHTWIAGRALYRGLGRVDAGTGVDSWRGALDAILQHDAVVDEVQYWGHGKWGEARVKRDVLDEGTLTPGHPLHARLVELKARLHPQSLFWFRTCETFGGTRGHAFAMALSSFLGCNVAGHTFIIGPWQSGLHLLRPGALPHWSSSEGIREGTPEKPVRAFWSTPFAPSTITCFHGRVPPGV